MPLNADIFVTSSWKPVLMSRLKYLTLLRTLCLFAGVSLLAIAPVQAAEVTEDDPASGMANLIYYTLGNSFVTNYDGAGRLKYLKTDIAVRIEPGTAPMLDMHLPYIRNKLVVLLAAQLEENLISTEGKEALRIQALNEIKAALDYLVSPGYGERVRNLYFTSFVVQR